MAWIHFVCSSQTNKSTRIEHFLRYKIHKYKVRAPDKQPTNLFESIGWQGGGGSYCIKCSDVAQKRVIRKRCDSKEHGNLHWRSSNYRL